MSILQRLRELREKQKEQEDNKIKDSKLNIGVSNDTINEIINNPENKLVYKISYSEYSSFQNCPHKWFLSYMLKFPGDASEELIFGSAVHDTIEKVLTNKSLRSMVMNNKKLIEGVFANTLKEGITNINDLELLEKMKQSWVFPTFYKQGIKILNELDIFYRFKDYEIIDVEYKLDNTVITETNEYIITFKGFIDLVLKHKKTNKYLILDWKTSKKKWDLKKKESDENFYNQLKLYKFYYSRKKNIPLENIDVCFFNLPREEEKNMGRYDKEVSISDVLEFEKKFKENCEKILNFNIFALDKSKHLTKKNFCHRCKFNTEDLCDDITQYQTIKLNKE